MPTASDSTSAVDERASTSTSEQSLPAAQPEASSSSKTELQTLIDSIPFTKLAIWSLFGLLVSQLHDFFGVRKPACVVTPFAFMC